MNKLTDRQRMVLDYICESIQDRGYPPTLREIGLKLGIRSTNGVNDHLRALERKGYLTREDMKSRTLRPTDITLRLVGPAMSSGSPLSSLGRGGDAFGRNGASSRGGGALAERNGSLAERNGSPTSEVERARAAEAANDDMIEIPILGRVAAGLPIEAIEHHGGDTVRIDRMLLGRGARGGDVFGLRIVGESMIEAGIHDGDYVFVRKQAEAARGTIVIAMVGDEATCKYFYPESTHVRLEPANSAMAPILVPKSEWRETQILGVVVGIFRKI
ncbi:MAG: transcriptional repressor LexA [Myxococcota bacterium]|nr:transcriptional repressor LexA [Myxococcota bacterium]